jgi:hypothetical protein
MARSEDVIFTMTLHKDGKISYDGKQPRDGLDGLAEILETLAAAAREGGIAWEVVE